MLPNENDYNWHSFCMLIDVMRFHISSLSLSILAVMTTAGSSQAKRDTALKAHEHVPVNIHATFQASYMYMLQNLAKHMLAI
jgi:hypothetical protein